MPYYKATIEILVETDDEDDACDALSETMRPLMKRYADDPELTAIIDWHYTSDGTTYFYPVEDDGDGFDL